ncbi:putative cyclin-D7-1 [Impatiens glandulifera]|uniref:putative cyclin-D7-1 n=1 Tax=Impatiens glandulifera TaxID=253017 RepID=UPI001FB106F8|nr:putative cyclin-D7-1 [Impatiens glandulifera]
MDDNILLCDEVLIMKEDDEICILKNPNNYKKDCEETFYICLNKELDFLPQFGYVTRLRSSGLLFSRFKSVQSIIKSQCRLNLSFETVFNAVSFLDRFISINQCHGWKDWMMELLSVACLSVASKFGETENHTLHEIQMKGLKLSYSFEPKLIQRMELNLMKVLNWRLMSTTSFSYVELLTWNITSNHFLTVGSINLLLTTLLDVEFVEFRPSIVAMASLMCIIKKKLHYSTDLGYDLDDYLAYITTLIPQDHMDDLMKCEEKMSHDHGSYMNGTIIPSSPNTVLGGGMEDVHDLCNFFKISEHDLMKPNMVRFSGVKRKREK